MMGFAAGNKMLERLEEKYQKRSQVYKTKYSVVFSRRSESETELVDAEKLKVGDGQYLNAYYQVKDNEGLSKQ